MAPQSKSIAAVAVAVLAMLFLAAPGTICPADAQATEGCTNSCKAAFGACYKSTANRAACEAQLQRCLQGCISTRR